MREYVHMWVGQTRGIPTSKLSVAEINAILDYMSRGEPTVLLEGETHEGVIDQLKLELEIRSMEGRL